MLWKKTTVIKNIAQLIKIYLQSAVIIIINMNKIKSINNDMFNGDTKKYFYVNI